MCNKVEDFEKSFLASSIYVTVVFEFFWEVDYFAHAIQQTRQKLEFKLGNNETEDRLSNIPTVTLQTGMCSATRLIGNVSYQAPHVPCSSSPQTWEMRDEGLQNLDFGLVALSATVLFGADEKQLRGNLCVNR